jgi:hypothetical protein
MTALSISTECAAVSFTAIGSQAFVITISCLLPFAIADSMQIIQLPSAARNSNSNRFGRDFDIGNRREDFVNVKVFRLGRSTLSPHPVRGTAEIVGDGHDRPTVHH